MATPAELAQLRTDLDPVELEHLQRLLGSWSLLADLAFSDLLLMVPVAGTTGDLAEASYVVLGQIRPNNRPTLVPSDLVGRTISGTEWPSAASAMSSGRMTNGEILRLPVNDALSVELVPIQFRGEIIGLLVRVVGPLVGAAGLYEQLYTDVFHRLCQMVSEAAFPFPDADVYIEGNPRVGDGMLVTDGDGTIEFASPNAVNALHRVGVFSPPENRRIGDLGIEVDAIESALETGLPVITEIERKPDVAVRVHTIPLIASDLVTGSIVLMRDVTDVRRLGRLVLSKDTAIREVHHRVKNNLQTISSLLRLQARRADGPEGRMALLEAERRVRSIALVHEVLSREPGDQVPFDDIITSLVQMAEDSVVTEQPVQITVTGDLGDVSAEIATPLAVTMAELLQNAVEHAFAKPDAAVEVDGSWVIRHEELLGQVEVDLHHDERMLNVQIRDNGRGLPIGFTLDSTTSLGLSIVRDLIESQLGGTLEMFSDGETGEGGTIARFSIPVGDD